MIASCELHPDGTCRYMIEAWEECVKYDVPPALWAMMAAPERPRRGLVAR